MGMFLAFYVHCIFGKTFYSLRANHNLRIDEMFKRHERDLELLGLVAQKPVSFIADHFGISETEVYKWLKRIRGRMAEYQIYLNKIYAKQRSSKRVKKFTIDGSLPDEDEPDEELTI